MKYFIFAFNQQSYTGGAEHFKECAPTFKKADARAVEYLETYDCSHVAILLDNTLQVYQEYRND
jgi:hypothetical protein